MACASRSGIFRGLRPHAGERSTPAASPAPPSGFPTPAGGQISPAVLWVNKAQEHGSTFSGNDTCALGQKACREGLSAQYWRLPRLFKALEIARGDGSYPKLLRGLAKKDLLILDDWGLVRLKDPERQDLLEIMEDRYDVRSTIVTSQVPVKKWHDMVGNPTFADAILDRLIHNAYRIDLKGESLRKPQDALK